LIVADLSLPALRATLGGEGLRLCTGPLVTCIRSGESALAAGIARQYADFPLAPADGFVDFHVAIERPRLLRRWWRPQAFFWFDGQSLFLPLPAAQAFPLLEWGMNWCVSSHCHQYLIIHAAVVERHGLALILPAPPGSGKSTLCAALVNSGWRLLSDELALIDPATGMLQPLPRPVSLKNASIDIIQSFAPKAIFNPPVFETIKGTVAHMRPPADSVRRANETARPRWLVLPRFVAGSATALTPLSKAQGLMQLAENAFNYSAHGRAGFLALGQLIDSVDCYRFEYSRLEEAMACFDALADAAGKSP